MSAKKKREPAPKPPVGVARYTAGNLFSIARKNASAAIWASAICFVAWQAAGVLKAYAGRQSNADININVFGGLLANFRFVVSISLAWAGGATYLYFRERQLHRKVRERLGARVRELELVVDPDRTSSRLTSEGLTREEDR